MKMRNVLILSFIALILSALSLTLVSAQNVFGTDIGRGAEMLMDIVRGIFEPILSFLFGSSELLFEKFLFLMILFALIGVILKRVPIFAENKGARIVVIITVSLLATRFLAETVWAQAVLLPYSVLGVALLSFIPFLIFFWFVEKGVDSKIMRKIAWSLYAVVFLGLFWSRYNDIGSPAWIFFATAILAIIVLLADSTIQGYFVRSAIEQGLDISRTKELVKIKKEIEEINSLLGSATGEQRRKLIKDLANKEDAFKDLSKRPY